MPEDLEAEGELPTLLEGFNLDAFRINSGALGVSLQGGMCSLPHVL
jgi:hypothetical protein